MSMVAGDPVKRFWSKVEKTDGCWIWRGTMNGVGYGVFWLPMGKPRNANSRVYAHRLSYEMHEGKIPDGMFICHRCDNPACVNPDHLFLGTQSDNMTDCSRKGRLR